MRETWQAQCLEPLLGRSVVAIAGKREAFSLLPMMIGSNYAVDSL